MDPRPFPCCCGYRGRSREALRQHIEGKHQNAPGFPAPVCPECREPSRFYEDSSTIYGGTDWGALWACRGCDTRVGAHRGTCRAKGTLAGATLRRMRERVKVEFNPIWQRGYTSRGGAYAELAAALGIGMDQTHIAMFDYETCRRAIVACQEIGPRLRDTAEREAA